MAFRAQRYQGYKPTAPSEAIAEGFPVNIADRFTAVITNGFHAKSDNGAGACPGRRSDRTVPSSSDRTGTSGLPLTQTTTGHVERDCCNGY
jgi:hypothetical protein